MISRAILAVAAALMVLAFGTSSFAQTDCKSLVPASPWGPNDQTGATNRVTPAVTKAAAAEIRDGKVIVMSYPLTDGVPLFGSRFTKTILTATSLAPGAAFGENELTYMEDTWLSQSHVAASLPIPGSPELYTAFWAGNCSNKSPQPVWMMTMSPSRNVTLYILSPAWMSAAVMTVPLSRHGFLQAELALSLLAC